MTTKAPVVCVCVCSRGGGLGLWGFRIVFLFCQHLIFKTFKLRLCVRSSNIIYSLRTMRNTHLFDLFNIKNAEECFSASELQTASVHRFTFRKTKTVIIDESIL